jgi:hypothetical protein
MMNVRLEVLRRQFRTNILSQFSSEDGGRMFIRNVVIFFRVHTASHPRKTTSTNKEGSSFIDFVVPVDLF